MPSEDDNDATRSGAAGGTGSAQEDAVSKFLAGRGVPSSSSTSREADAAAAEAKEAPAEAGGAMGAAAVNEAAPNPPPPALAGASDAAPAPPTSQAAALKSPPQTSVARSTSPGKAAKSPGSPSKTSPNAVDPTFDPNVVPAVHSIVHLLQIYGPLTYEQLKFNMNPQLVPIHAPNPALPTLPPLKPGQKPPLIADMAKSRVPRDRLQRVLDMLHELGVIHIVDKGKLAATTAVGGAGGRGVPSAPAATVTARSAATANAESASTSAAKEGGENDEPQPPPSKPKSAVEDDPNPIYCFGDGMPRMDVVQPSQLLNEIRAAGEEVQRAQQRIELLKEALVVADGASPEEAGPATETADAETAVPAAETEASGKAQPNRSKAPKGMTPQHALSTLKKLLNLHPEIVRDPVYAAALRMFKVPPPSAAGGGPHDEAALDRHGKIVDNSPEMERILAAGRLQSSVGGGGGLKKRASGTLALDRGADGSGAGSGSKKKRKKGRPSKSASSGSLKGGGGSAEPPAVHANASWA
ncbi:hypothetical protein ACHAXT_007892 [Thalassiosira profunda]